MVIFLVQIDFAIFIDLIIAFFIEG